MHWINKSQLAAFDYRLSALLLKTDCNDRFFREWCHCEEGAATVLNVDEGQRQLTGPFLTSGLTERDIDGAPLVHCVYMEFG